MPFSQLAKSQNGPLRFQPVDQLERQKLGQGGQSVQRFRAERQKLETRVAAPSTGQPANRLSPATVKLPTSPIVARPTAELDRNRRSAADARGAAAGIPCRGQAETDSCPRAAAGTRGESTAVGYAATEGRTADATTAT